MLVDVSKESVSGENLCQKKSAKLKIQNRKIHQVTTQLTILGLVNYTVVTHDSSFNNLVEQNILDFKSILYESIGRNVKTLICLRFHYKL